MNNFKSKKSKKKVQSAIKLSIFVCAIFAAFLIFQVASVANVTHKKIDKNRELSEFQEKNKESDIQIARLKASQNIKQSAQNLEMINVSDVKYVNIENNSNVAVNR